jgi:hypothetical protein
MTMPAAADESGAARPVCDLTPSWRGPFSKRTAANGPHDHCCKQQTHQIPHRGLSRIRSREPVLALHGHRDELDHSRHHRPRQGRQERRRADQHPAARPSQRPGRRLRQLRGNEERSTTRARGSGSTGPVNAVTINNAEENKSSIDLYGEIKPALVDWGQEKQRDEIVDGFYAIPSQAAPAGLGSALGQRVNGILFDAATAAQRNTWITDNADRILIGSGNTANLVAGNFAASMANITGAMTLSGALINRMKRSAKKPTRASVPSS